MNSGRKNGVTHIHQIYIRASAQTIWEAITDPARNGRYGYQAVSEYELRPGGKFRALANAQMRSFGLPEVMIDGEVIEVQPASRLVQTYRWLFNDEHRAEGYTRLAFDIEPTSAGFCKLTITHDVSGAPMMSAATQSGYNEQGGGGWIWIQSDLKSLLETGRTMGS